MSEIDIPEYKVVLVGEARVGKSAILSKYLYNEFDKNYTASYSPTSFYKEIELKELNKVIKLNVWDTMGEEKFRALTELFYRGAKGVIMVYDITSKKSYDELISFWHPKIKELFGNNIGK